MKTEISKATLAFNQGSAKSLDRFAVEIKRISAPGIDALWAPNNEGGFELIEIWSETARGVGYASKYLREAVALADELSVTLTLCVHPCFYNLDDTTDIPAATVKLWERLDKKALMNDDLIAWYERLGFEREPGSDEENPRMLRRPESRPSTQ